MQNQKNSSNVIASTDSVAAKSWFKHDMAMVVAINVLFLVLLLVLYRLNNNGAVEKEIARWLGL